MKLRHRAVSIFTVIFILIVLNSCGIIYHWELNVVRNGIRFDKLRSSRSGTIIGFLSSDTLIQNYYCRRGWIHFYDDWSLKNFFLCKVTDIYGFSIPVDTWMKLDKDGDLVLCAFPHNMEIQGYWCKGTGGPSGVQTSFYKNGQIKYFFSPFDVDIDGIPCCGGVFHIIGFHENGVLKTARLYKSAEIRGVKYRKGYMVEFNADGKCISEG